MLKRFPFHTFEIYQVESAKSTNDFSEFQEQIILEDRAVIWANTQTKGVGRFSRPWSSPKGNLAFSLYLDISKFKQPIYELAFLAAVAVYDGVLALLPEVATDLKLKWPNDMLLDRKKCCGILIERQDDSIYQNFVAVGIGLNLVKAIGATDYAITCLKNYAPIDSRFEPYDYLCSILSRFDDLLGVWTENGFDPILHRWQRAMVHQKGDRVSIRLGEHQEDVTFEHIAGDGSLMYSQAGEIKKHYAGDVLLK